jgi:predicted DNA-binding transcriptional regulator AlpA
MGSLRPFCSNIDKYITPKEGAYLCGVSVWTLYNWINSATPPPYVRRGKLYFFPRKEFTAWADQKIIR